MKPWTASPACTSIASSDTAATKEFVGLLGPGSARVIYERCRPQSKRAGYP